MLRSPLGLIVAILIGLPWQSDAAAQRLDELPAKKSDLYRADVVEFDIDGSKAFVVKPRRPHAAGRKPWIWSAPALTNPDGTWNLPAERHARAVDPLLDQGFYYCGVDVGESWGNPAGRVTYTRFHRWLVDRFGLDPEACLFPVSRGGLMHYNWAAEHPQAVRCIGAIYPVCEFETRARNPSVASAYRLEPDELVKIARQHSPIERLAPLAKAGIPLLHVHGDSDAVVPLETNSAELARRYRALGGNIELIVVPGKGHEFAAEYWENPHLAEFFLRLGSRD